MLKQRFFLFVLLIITGLAACKNKNALKRSNTDTPTKGTIHISVDETFRPVIEEEIKVFESSYPDAHIIAHYKPEAECLTDLLTDSIRMVIVTHGLKPEEREYIRDSTGYMPGFDKLAFDAIAVIVNRNNAKDSFTLAELKELLEGKNDKGLYAVFDARTATSTIRYAIDSILRGSKPGSNIYAANDSKGVIEFVGNNENAVGFVGISWIGNREDSAQIKYLQKVKITSLQCDTCINKPFILPDQKNIYNGKYPLIRPLVYILKENYSGLGKGFSGFMQLERGQLIFRRAYLYPAHMNFLVRNTTL
jgi:phosphate transport system substrate-binding protein